MSENLTLRVNEIFYSVQGEGARVGEPSVFVRLSGCDLACAFCDTEFESGEPMSVEEIYAKVREIGKGCNWIVWTGGEPTLQLGDAHVAYFNDLQFSQAIETNGNHPVPKGLAWVAVSPKVAEHVLVKNFPNGVDELRYVRHAGQPGIPKPSVKAAIKFLSPMSTGDKINPENLRHVIALCLANPGWRLSVQTHKLWRVL